MEQNTKKDYYKIAIDYWTVIKDGSITSSHFMKQQQNKLFQLIETEEHHTKEFEAMCWLTENTYTPELQKNLELLPWMVAAFFVIIGFQSLKLFYLEIGRKNSKTSSILMPLQIWEAFTKTGSETHFISSDDLQSKTIYRQFKLIVEQNPFLKMAIHTKGTFAYNPSLGSLLMNHSAKSKKLDSYKNSLTLLDEYHAYDDDNALVQSRYGGAQRDKSLICITTSAGLSTTNAGYQERLNAEAYLKSDELRKDYFAMIYAIDPEDDWEDESVWIKQNPSLGPITKWEQFRFDADEQKKQPLKLINFKAKRLGLYQNLNTVKWFNSDKIEQVNNSPIDMPCEKLRGINNSITFDLSEVDDFTVVTKTWIINELIYQKHYYFLPEMAVYDVYSKSKKAINNMLPLWVEQGYVELCPGETISYTQVCDKIIGLIDPQTKIIGYDSYHAKDIVDTLNNRYKRLPLVSLKQSSLQLTEPIKQMEKLILDEELKTVDNDPVFQWMLENATIKQSTGSEFRKIYKPAKSDVNKIDAVITSLLGIQCIQLPVFKQKTLSANALL